jgi:hypothetical protein
MFRSAALSSTVPTSIDLGSNPGHRCGKPATNRLSYRPTLYNDLNLQEPRGRIRSRIVQMNINADSVRAVAA